MRSLNVIINASGIDGWMDSASGMRSVVRCSLCQGGLLAGVCVGWRANYFGISHKCVYPPRPLAARINVRGRVTALVCPSTLDSWLDPMCSIFNG